MGGIGGRAVKWNQLAYNQLMSQQGPHFSPQSKAKANNKKHKSQEISIAISDVVPASVYSEKTRVKKMIMIIIIIITEKPLRVESHSNSSPPMQKNSGLLTQKLLAASNGELYTAM